MCGCRFCPSSRSPAALTRSWMARGPRRRPFWLTNRAPSGGLLKARSGSHRARASRAFFAHGQHAGLAALAQDLHQPVRQIQLLEVQAGQFGEAQPAGVEQLQDGLVAMGQEVIFHCAIEQLQGAIGVQGLGQAAFALGRRQAVGRVVIAQPFAVQIVIEPAHRGQQACQAAGRLTLLVQAGDHAAQSLDIQVVPAADLLFLAEPQHFVEIASIGLQGMRRHLALTAQVRAVGIQLLLHAQRTERSEWVKRGRTRPVTSAM